MHIVEQEKLSYIRGKTKPPKELEDGYEKWYAENQKVKRWFLMSMSLEIMKRYLRLPTAQEIWSALSKTFYDGSDKLQVFTLNKKSFTTKQSSMSFSKYYGELTETFCELDHLDKVVMKDTDDIAAYRKSIEQQRMHIFLAGLDGDFEQVRGEILLKDHVLDLEVCYALIQREAVRHTSMKVESDNPDTSAMVVRQRSTQNWQDQSKINHPKTTPNIDKSTFKCTHCNKTGHTKSRYFELVGYLDWWDHNRDKWKNDSKKTLTIAVVEIKTEDNVVEKASAMVAVIDYGGKDIRTRQTIGCSIKRGKLYYLDLQSKDSNKLRQALMADGSEGKKKKSEI
ncbi:hypothetical protein CK203_055832 [Vitis vinifera]|uniref:Retrotransposon gag domain-containing protein n=1 Tax=Vitis vinifera TaxID=29760 RepID=A0A438H6J1_VITVI|nr:hypothetical protein CK203_055832 [Vitis vinifera]